MSEYPRLVARIALRLLVALPFFVGGYWLITAGWTFLFGIMCFLVGALILAPAITEFLAEPFGSLVFPDARYEKPPPVYGIAESETQKGHYEHALALYQEIALKYPKELKPYEDMIDIAIVRLRDPARAELIGISATLFASLLFPFSA